MSPQALTNEFRAGGRTFRLETDTIDVTRGPEVYRDEHGNPTGDGYPGDPYRKQIPGPTRFYVDDEEITAEAFAAALYEAHSGSPE